MIRTDTGTTHERRNGINMDGVLCYLLIKRHVEICAVRDAVSHTAAASSNAHAAQGFSQIYLLFL